MQAALKWLTAMFGAACIAIALLHIAFGPAAIPGSVPVNATMDSEDRFYATLFLGFGVALIWASRDLALRRGAFLALLAVFFVGGLARVISWIAVGPPGEIFIAITLVELILPPVFVWWHGAAFGHRRSGDLSSST